MNERADATCELVLSLRRDGVAEVADEIQTALGGTAGAGSAVDAIAGADAGVQRLRRRSTRSASRR